MLQSQIHKENEGREHVFIYSLAPFANIFAKQAPHLVPCSAKVGRKCGSGWFGVAGAGKPGKKMTFRACLI